VQRRGAWWGRAGRQRAAKRAKHFKERTGFCVMLITGVTAATKTAAKATKIHREKIYFFSLNFHLICTKLGFKNKPYF